ncbi:MAG: aminotransferase class V-fold PLP-dependent enzyme [Alphaproteobacteria bacterium]|nr:aminotransferase class V-fold PLP-dependent enzyme [Alphaproteobacteria bacterium]
MVDRVYFDWNATAPLRPEARAAVDAALDLVGNPSSVHAEGRAARQVLEKARESVAALVGGDPRCVTFTSGGTEANVLALGPGNGGRDRLLVSAIEHPSVLAGGCFAAEVVEQIPVTTGGIVDLVVLERRLAALAAEGRAPLVSLMLANNETGVVQPVAQAAGIVHRAGGVLHVDAVQAAGRIPIDINALGADLLTLSGHKIGAPKGVGALIRRHRDQAIGPLITGGGQETRLRAGTENVAGIAGFGAAAAAAAEDLVQGFAHITALRDGIEHYLSRVFRDVTIFGATSKRIPNTTLFALPGVKAETAVIALDLAGVAVSSGAACSSGKVAPSHVLAAMGVPPELARGALRLSLGATTTEADVESFQNAWNKVLRSLLKGSRNIAA